MQLIMDYLFLVDQRALLAVQDRIEIIFDPIENILSIFLSKFFWSTYQKRIDESFLDRFLDHVFLRIIFSEKFYVFF